jgi:hypothetical protein
VKHRLRLGETAIDVVVSGPNDAKLVFSNLHDDENTAVEAGLVAMRSLGGRLVELQHGGKRDVSFRVAGGSFAVDPNRIFTPEGVRRTLTGLSHHTPAAQGAVEQFAKDLLALYAIDRADAVFALHNNSDGNYSALTYAKGGRFAADAAAVFTKDGSDPDDFFFVTETAVFDALRRRGLNVVLQNNRGATDDGSLSVYCGRSGVRYINIEAQSGHLKQQVAMILALADVLKELRR